MNNLRHILQKGFYAGLALICFLLPFQPGFMATVEITVVALFIIGHSPRFIWQNLSNNRFVLPYILFFILVIIWYFFSSETQEAGRQVEVKMAFGIIPILLAGSGIQGKKAENLVRLFVVSNGIAAMILLFMAVLRFYKTGESAAFFYTEFSHFIHVTYFSMYMLFCMAWLLMKGVEEYQKFPLMFGIPILLFAVCIFLASAKMMIITLVFATAFMAIYIGRRKNTWGPALFLFILGFLLPVLLYNLSENFKLRVNYGMKEITEGFTKRNPETIGSTGLRMVVWSETMPIIMQRLPLGMGPGNVQNKLQEIYIEKGMTHAESRKFNMHNEYLQQLAGNGIPGLILFLFIVLLPYFLSAQPMKFASFIFSVTLLMASLSESIFERQAGTLFAGLIGVLLILSYRRISKPSNS